MSRGDKDERGASGVSGSERDFARQALDPVPLDSLQDEALRWFVDLQAADGKPAVRQAFDEWLARDQRHAAAFAEVENVWRSAELGRALTHGRHRENVVPLAVRQDRRVAAAARSWRRTVGAIAAILILAVAGAHLSGLLVYLRADYVTATGQQRRIGLPDGSTVLLNSGSAVALDFNAARRGVRLIEGEAFFEVVRNPDRPFQVTSRFADVEVIGTAFSVRVTGERDSVTLQQGSLSVQSRVLHDRAVKLVPLSAVAVGATETSTVDTVNPDDAFAWLEGRIRFRDRPFGDVLDELRRYHRGVIIVANGRIKNIRVSGNYRLDDPAVIVASLAEAVGAKLTRISDHILILR